MASKVYKRVTDTRDSLTGKTYREVDHISIREGLAIVNSAMMGDDRRKVSRMSSSKGNHSITYRSGRTVRLTEVTAPEPVKPANGAHRIPDAWTVASAKTLLHRFTSADENGRAVCNKRFRPRRYADGYAFRTKAEQRASEYAFMYTFCPRCESM